MKSASKLTFSTTKKMAKRRRKESKEALVPVPCKRIVTEGIKYLRVHRPKILEALAGLSEPQRDSVIKSIDIVPRHLLNEACERGGLLDAVREFNDKIVARAPPMKTCALWSTVTPSILGIAGLADVFVGDKGELQQIVIALAEQRKKLKAVLDKDTKDRDVVLYAMFGEFDAGICNVGLTSDSVATDTKEWQDVWEFHQRKTAELVASYKAMSWFFFDDGKASAQGTRFGRVSRMPMTSADLDAYRPFTRVHGTN